MDKSMDIPMDIHEKICGYGYGYGWEISYPRQPCAVFWTRCSFWMLLSGATCNRHSVAVVQPRQHEAARTSVRANSVVSRWRMCGMAWESEWKLHTCPPPKSQTSRLSAPRRESWKYVLHIVSGCMADRCLRQTRTTESTWHAAGLMCRRPEPPTCQGSAANRSACTAWHQRCWRREQPDIGLSVCS